MFFVICSGTHSERADGGEQASLITFIGGLLLPGAAAICATAGVVRVLVGPQHLRGAWQCSGLLVLSIFYYLFLSSGLGRFLLMALGAGGQR